MLGLDDPWILSGYLLCIASAALCIIYGWITWNRGDEPVKPQDVRWANAEDRQSGPS